MSQPRELPRTSQVLKSGIDSGLHLGAQLYVSLRGEVIADFALGHARLDGTPMRPDTINHWMSSVKPVAAVAIGQLRERGLLDWSDRVMKFIPEFAQGGKETITIEHLLTHTAGFRMGSTEWSVEPWEATVARVCSVRLEPRWVPGEKAGYHPSSAWIILGEIVRRVDPAHRTYDVYVRQEIFEPLEMLDSWCGMPADRFKQYRDRLGEMYDTSTGTPAVKEQTQGPPTADLCALVRPGANGRGPIRELGRFYQMLAAQTNEVGTTNAVRPPASPIHHSTARDLVAAHRTGLFDHTFKHDMDWGLGSILNTTPPESRRTMPYGYGRHASARTFGHSGALSSCAFCDPAHGLAVAWLCNGMPKGPAHQRRQRAINEAVYEDLNLVA